MSYRPALSITNSTIDTLLSHHSVRAYSARPLSPAHIEAIVAAASSAATSSNQNSWSVVAVADPAKRKALQETTGKNEFINEAPLFLVWVADLYRAHENALAQGLPFDGLRYQEALLVATVDATLAAQNAVVAAESLGLGTCYVGGIRTNIPAVSELLNLPESTYPVVGLAVGWPADRDTAGVKPRLPLSAVFHQETYDRAASVAGISQLTEDTREYFRQQGRPGVDWAQVSARRWRGTDSMNGREHNRAVIAERGLLDR